ncbi:hypothetical protein GPECTOR_5g209 [Gonium pectorale]|uniref:SAP domain-containing protein n=1 Tax=Gonium pectorale TaxID=33097 RepID=A0A150GW38_GONPE|nr:hypothetical protein GPECTOR_5g209 [Gonium pectorale]|eukprot:KXZ54106.1 hypothetical protein GPECTOR_5g209 [Gonium pectorale]
MADEYQYGDGDGAWDEENEEEEEDQKQRPESQREKLIFLIDAQDSMFEKIEWTGETMSCFEAARRAVVELIKLKAVQQPDDSVAVVLYNTLCGRVEALQGYRLKLRFFPLAAVSRPLDSGRLWRALLRALRGAEQDGGSGGGGYDGGEAEGDVADDEATLAELAKAPAERRDPLAAVVSLFDSFRRRLARKRTLMRLHWRISDRLSIALRGYLLIADAYKAARKTLPVNPVTNQPLKISTTLVSTSDGRVLDREAITSRKRFKLKTGNTGRMPEVCLPSSEVSPAALLPPGLALLGFKPLACLQPHHTALRPPLFLRPDEAAAAGSTRAFIALWRAMLAHGRFALCRYKRGPSAPQLVALVAQDERVDAYGLQTDPPGIHLYYLPYMDDVRHPEAMGALPPTLTDEQLAAAARLVDALPLGLDPAQLPNPALQRHYQVIESLALSEPLPEWRALEDDATRPSREAFQAGDAPDAIEAFRAAFPQSGGGGARGTKRKADGEPGAAAASKAQKAEAVADAYGAIDWAAKLRSGELSRLTKDDLTIYLRRHQLKVTGKKDELVSRVAEHLSSQGGA